LFLEIAETRELTLLIIEGSAMHEELVIAWEKIIAQNSSANNSLEYSSYVNHLRQLAKMLNEFTMLKSAVFVLALNADKDVIDFLKKKGHIVDTSSDQAYDKSLERLVKKHDALATQITMKQNQIQALSEKEVTEQVGFDQIMASLSAQIGFTVPEDVTLARYNEYKKIIKQKAKKNGTRT
jgi:hypothetical protein